MERSGDRSTRKEKERDQRGEREQERMIPI
jgi:hypothetical protein